MRIELIQQHNHDSQFIQFVKLHSANHRGQLHPLWSWCHQCISKEWCREERVDVAQHSWRNQIARFEQSSQEGTCIWIIWWCKTCISSGLHVCFVLNGVQLRINTKMSFWITGFSGYWWTNGEPWDTCMIRMIYKGNREEQKITNSHH